MPLRVLVGGLLLLLPLSAAAAMHAQTALAAALRGTPAVGLVVSVTTGDALASVGPAAAVRSTPGSLLKPFFLAAALERGYVRPDTTVFCRRALTIREAGRDWNLACTHPQTEGAFTAQDALAYSCNRYFADLADRIPPQQTANILLHYGLPPQGTQTREQKQLLVLGVAGIAVSPAQVAGAYRRLATELAQTPALQPVAAGLKDSVSYGMAHAAAVPATEILGKTGTATNRDHGPSHGWFAGIGSIGHQSVVVVVYFPQGNGADAARLGRHFFLAAKATP